MLFGHSGLFKTVDGCEEKVMEAISEIEPWMAVPVVCVIVAVKLLWDWANTKGISQGWEELTDE